MSRTLEILGDRWSLLIVRDLIVRGYTTFKEFAGSGEGIATNVLADRLRRLEEAGILAVEGDAKDGRRRRYRLTEKGIDLAAVVLEMLLWGSRHDRACRSSAAVLRLEGQREALLAEVRKRWQERDTRPILAPGEWGFIAGRGPQRGSAARPAYARGGLGPRGPEPPLRFVKENL